MHHRDVIVVKSIESTVPCHHSLSTRARACRCQWKKENWQKQKKEKIIASASSRACAYTLTPYSNEPTGEWLIFWSTTSSCIKSASAIHSLLCPSAPAEVIEATIHRDQHILTIFYWTRLSRCLRFTFCERIGQYRRASASARAHDIEMIITDEFRENHKISIWIWK